jgi:hypothetical protein
VIWRCGDLEINLQIFRSDDLCRDLVIYLRICASAAAAHLRLPRICGGCPRL